jgi:hypothetical protein
MYMQVTVVRCPRAAGHWTFTFSVTWIKFLRVLIQVSACVGRFWSCALTYCTCISTSAWVCYCLRMLPYMYPYVCTCTCTYIFIIACMQINKIIPTVSYHHSHVRSPDDDQLQPDSMAVSLPLWKKEKKNLQFCTCTMCYHTHNLFNYYCTLCCIPIHTCMHLVLWFDVQWPYKMTVSDKTIQNRKKLHCLVVNNDKLA